MPEGATVDWSRWAELEELRQTYLDILAAERNRNRMRWSAMSPTQRARYPELKEGR